MDRKFCSAFMTRKLDEAPPGLTEDEVPDFDWEACPVLKKEIIRQAAEAGIAADDLEFFRFY